MITLRWKLYLTRKFNNSGESKDDEKEGYLRLIRFKIPVIGIEKLGLKAQY